MIKYPSINQFRNVIRDVRTRAQWAGRDEDGNPIIDASRPIPTLKFVGTTKVHGCVSSDTLVTLADGSSTPIKYIKKGDRILSFDEHKQKNVVSIVEEALSDELEKTWSELTFSDGRVVRCTDDHPFYTQRGWVASSDLTNEDEIKYI